MLITLAGGYMFHWWYGCQILLKIKEKSDLGGNVQLNNMINNKVFQKVTPPLPHSWEI